MLPSATTSLFGVILILLIPGKSGSSMNVLTYCDPAVSHQGSALRKPFLSSSLNFMNPTYIRGLAFAIRKLFSEIAVILTGRPCVWAL
jgi:hypothetical protein